jgi:hypothetical protein
MQQIEIAIGQHNALAATPPLLHVLAKLLPPKNLVVSHLSVENQ